MWILLKFRRNFIVWLDHFWGANKHFTTRYRLNCFGFGLNSCWKPWLECVKQTVYTGDATFLLEMGSIVCVRACDFEMHACIAPNIFALHLERPCTSKSIRNTIHEMCVFLHACLPVIGLGYMYIFQLLIPDSYLSLAFSHILLCSFVVLLHVSFSVSFRFVSFLLIRLIRLYFFFVATLELLHCRLCNRKAACCPAATSRLAIRDISRWCYKMGIVVRAVSNFDAFLTCTSLPPSVSHPLCIQELFSRPIGRSHYFG